MRHGGWAWGIAVAALGGAVLAALALGRYPVPLSVLSGLDTMDPAMAAVLWNVRLPRVLAATLVGAALAGAGAAFQGMFRNPLASPDLLGVSVGASLGAVLGIFFGLPVVGVQAAAFLGGLSAVAAVALLNEKPQPTNDDINEAMTNICRCGTYQRIRVAIHSVAGGKA